MHTGISQCICPYALVYGNNIAQSIASMSRVLYTIGVCSVWSVRLTRGACRSTPPTWTVWCCTHDTDKGTCIITPPTWTVCCCTHDTEKGTCRLTPPTWVMCSYTHDTTKGTCRLTPTHLSRVLVRSQDRERNLLTYHNHMGSRLLVCSYHRETHRRTNTRFYCVGLVCKFLCV